MLNPSRYISPILLILLLFTESSLAQQDIVGLPPDPDAKPNFEGSWQKDYRRSDDVEQKLNLTLANLRRQYERAQGRADTNISVGQTSNRGTSIVDLARFAELISRHNDIYITQTGDEVRIKRDGEADLVCHTGDEFIRSDSGRLGSEACGWSGDQLLFQINLPGSISVLYRFSVSDDRNDLNLQKRISSGDNMAFDLEEYFTRYETMSQQYECIQTLTRGRVCSRAGNPQ